MKAQNYLNYSWKIIKTLFLSFAFFSLFMFVFAFTTGPFWVYYWMGTSRAGITAVPDHIVLLGGGGMPSESGLIRCYHAAEVAASFPEAKVILSLPGDPEDSSSSICMMRHELLIREVDSSRIVLESDATNTRAQAMNIFTENKGIQYDNVVIVTSPEHLYRAVKTFERAGFSHVDGFPAFEEAIEADLFFDGEKLGGRKYIPEIGGTVQLRYQFWNHLKYEILILREFTAIAYYKIKGWI
jgi:uncharacterized SAM-binding protein YcdF (DUF218 family)